MRDPVAALGSPGTRLNSSACKTKSPVKTGPFVQLVPEVGLEPTSLAAEDFRTTSAFAAALAGVRGLEHAFTLALRL